MRFLPDRLASYSAPSAAATSALLLAPSAVASEATPNDAVTFRVPVAVGHRQLERLDPPADALGELVGALEVGQRQRHGHLLAAVAGRLVDVTRGLAQNARDRAQHVVAGEVAVGVVDAS